MKKCSKLIRLVDRSTGGWMIVQEYMPDELTSHSDNSRKRHQGNQKEKACISKESFVNVFICFSVLPVHLRKSDTTIHGTSFGMTPSQAKDKDGAL